MASVPFYSHRFIAEAGFTGSAAFLVPAGFVAVVRDIDAVIFTPGAGTIEAGIGGSAVFWGFTWSFVAVLGWESWRGRIVLNPGEQLVITTNTGMDFSASGYLLSLP
jgi:hypothetical protein